MSDATKTELSLRDEIAISRDSVRDHAEFDLWPVQHSTFSEYLERFKDVVDGVKLVDHLKTVPSPTIIDFMSSTDALVGLFPQLPQQDRLGIAVGLKDHRTPGEKARDEGLGVHQVIGDITSSATWRKLIEGLKGRKADVIVESAWGGISVLPASGGFYAVMAQRAWDLLSQDHGILIAELENPITLSDYGINLKTQIKRLNESGIPSVVDLSGGNSAVRLERTPQSPSKLPVF